MFISAALRTSKLAEKDDNHGHAARSRGLAIGGGWLGLRLTGSLNWLFAALALGLIVYAVALTVAITSGAWFARERTINARD